MKPCIAPVSAEAMLHSVSPIAVIHLRHTLPARRPNGTPGTVQKRTNDVKPTSASSVFESFVSASMSGNRMKISVRSRKLKT